MLSKGKMDTMIDVLQYYLAENIVLVGGGSYADVSIVTNFSEESDVVEYPNIILKGPNHFEMVVVFTKDDILSMMTGDANKAIERRMLDELIPINPYELSKSIALEKLGFQKYRDVPERDFKVDSLYVTLMINELRNRE